MLECPVDAFLADYSPFSPDDALVDAVIQALASERLLVMDGWRKPEHWQDFVHEPSCGGVETLAFQPLEAIVNIFGNDLEELNGRQINFFYRGCPNDEAKSDIAGYNFKVDTCFTGNPDHAQHNHTICSETAVAATSQKSAANFEDNRKKLFSAATYIMNNDPCRMWIYGITIENTEMAVWYFSRSHTVKSKTFDFTKDFRSFIRVFLSFVYATREEMGYDPTVHLIKGQGKRLQYVYEIPTENGTRYFKTIDLIAHQGAHCITGRNTRVWRAVEVNGFEGNAINGKLNGNREVALKDVWLDDGSKTEKQKLDAIFERLSTIKEDAYQWAIPPLRSKLKTIFENEGYKDYFMEIVCDSFDLGRSKKISEQATPAPGILEVSSNPPVEDDDGKGKAAEDRNLLTGSTQTTEYSHILKNENEVSHLKAYLVMKTRSFKVKRQYRLVYKEVGVSLDHVETLKTAFSALLDTYIALALMFLAGWMHRDVSAGNIIAVKRPDGQSGGKLSDLEHAKHCEDESTSSDPKTGTAFFMPLEIHMGIAYQGARSAPYDSEAYVDPFHGRLPTVQDLLFSRNAELPETRPARYRFQHDLESLWWVALYVLIYRVAHLPGNALAKLVFTKTSTPSLPRRELFEHNNAVMVELQKSLHPTLQHELILQSMNVIPHILYNSYVMDEPADPEALGQVYSRVFRNLAILVLTIKTEVGDVEFRSTCSVHPKKRAHSEMLSMCADDDAYREKEQEKEPSSGNAVPRRKRRASTSTGVRR